ncbi:MAG: ABC transporter substrate-binding protein [Clostridiales bacterium]|nr:ABC transporter substrate-binding protein [Clostridiales bacterium]
MRKRCLTAVFLTVLLFSCAACSAVQGDRSGQESTAADTEAESGEQSGEIEVPQTLGTLAYDREMEPDYAEGFRIDYYEGGFALITIESEGQYLVVPEGETAPEGLDGAITVLYRPIANVYLAASAVMDMYVSLDALADIRFSALDADGWYISEAAEKMEAGDIVYAGKYSAPDYELILSEGCGLAVENTMIYHTPEVKEELESLGIPVIVDYSSYESDPLGRMEWIMLYGVLTGREEQAAEVFDAQAALYESEEGEESGATVAFFYITSTGAVNVRKSSDYLPRMIEQAGGTYIFEDLGDEEETASSTVSMQMEEFYAAAKDADYLIYNSTIEGEVESMDDFLALSPLLENFKAVSEGHVYCTTKNLYQTSMELGTITSDIRKMLNGETGDMEYLYQVRE